MDDVDKLLSELSNLPGFQGEKSGVIRNYLVERGYVWQVRMGTLAPSKLLGKLRSELFLPTQAGAPEMFLLVPSDITSVEEDSLRQKVLSHLIALEAAKNREVQSYRQSVLGDKLLRWVDVQWWILVQALQDGRPATLWLHDIPIPREQGKDFEDESARKQKLSITLSQEQISQSGRYHYLQFGLPGSHQIYEVATTSGGILEMLRSLNLALAARYDWSEAQATLFVLTGLSPLVPAITTKLHIRQEASLSRIILEIDPTVSPAEVANHFLRQRHELVGLRQRDMSEKHLKLALFAAARSHKEKWIETMHRWNELFPHWSYKRETTFGSDAIAAQRRLLHPDYRRSVGLLQRGMDLGRRSSNEELSELEDENE